MVYDTLKCSTKESFESNQVITSIFNNITQLSSPEGYTYLDTSQIFKIEVMANSYEEDLNFNKEVTSKRFVVNELS